MWKKDRQDYTWQRRNANLIKVCTIQEGQLIIKVLLYSTFTELLHYFTDNSQHITF